METSIKDSNLWHIRYKLHSFPNSHKVHRVVQRCQARISVYFGKYFIINYDGTAVFFPAMDYPVANSR